MIDIQNLITQHSNGALLLEINDALAKVVADCCDTDKKGEISIKFSLEPLAMRNGGHQLKITPNVTTKNPKYDAGIGFFFVVTDENNEPCGLEREDPRQAQLFETARHVTMPGERE